MIVESSVTSVTWIPSEVFKGVLKLGMDLKLGHYDETPPSTVNGLPDLQSLRETDRLRMGNHLAGRADFDESGKPTGAEYCGGYVVGSTRTGIGPVGVTFAGVAMPMLQQEPEAGPAYVRFTQTAGGRTGVPMPRRVAHPPFVQWHAPIAWTTLTLTLHADGRSDYTLAGASTFPRHWVYGPDGEVFAKSGLIATEDWLKSSFGERTPWGDQDSAVLVSAAETGLENELSHTLMAQGKNVDIREVPIDTVIAKQGGPGDSLLILLDGIVAVDVDGEVLTEVGPGAVMGERAVLDAGTRTATLTARTPVRVAIANAVDIDRGALEELAEGHHREDQP